MVYKTPQAKKRTTMRESDAFSSMARNQLMGYFEKRRYNPISICGTMANY
jgi:hypothetical protein